VLYIFAVNGGWGDGGVGQRGQHAPNTVEVGLRLGKDNVMTRCHSTGGQRVPDFPTEQLSADSATLSLVKVNANSTRCCFNVGQPS